MANNTIAKKDNQVIISGSHDGNQIISNESIAIAAQQILNTGFEAFTAMVAENNEWEKYKEELAKEIITQSAKRIEAWDKMVGVQLETLKKEHEMYCELLKKSTEKQNFERFDVYVNKIHEIDERLDKKILEALEYRKQTYEDEREIMEIIQNDRRNGKKDFWIGVVGGAVVVGGGTYLYCRNKYKNTQT